ncbi:MAG: PAS domain S-box protein [Luteolibacter sp.]
MQNPDPRLLSNLNSDLFSKLVDSVVDYAMFTMSPEGIILNWNRGAERIKGYKAEEIIGSHFSRFYSEEDRATDFPGQELVIAEAEGHFTTEGWRYGKNGKRFWADVTITALKDDDEVLQGFMKITRDLTEQKIAMEALRQSEERFRLLIENVVEYAIFMLDPEGHVMSWNAGARRLKGYEDSEILGKHFSTFYPANVRSTKPMALMRKAVQDGSAEAEGWRVRKDGSQFWGNVVLTALYSADQELIGFAKITRDMTERRKIANLQESERQRKVFLATLAHELRNPLAPVLIGVDLLAHSKGDPALIDHVVPMLNRQVGQMSRLIDDLLDVSRVSTGKISLSKTRVSLEKIFETAVETVAPAMEAAGHGFARRFPAGTVEMEADHQRIAQVISNLLSNAVKFTPPGGHIELEAVIESDEMVRITVSDDGEGVDQKSQDQIFELFEQVQSGQNGGLGIGLTLVKTLTEMHGGSVSMTSGGKGCGSQFHVLLPYLHFELATTAETSSSVTKSRKPLRPSRVLVADDGRNTADVVALFFELEGMETAVAYDGAQAVDLAREFHPQVVFLDLGMPVMDGFEAARQIRQMNPDVVIIALSGWGAAEDRRRTTEAGFDFHMVKPVTPDDLRAMLQQLENQPSDRETH